MDHLIIRDLLRHVAATGHGLEVEVWEEVVEMEETQRYCLFDGVSAGGKRMSWIYGMIEVCRSMLKRLGGIIEIDVVIYKFKPFSENL